MIIKYHVKDLPKEMYGRVYSDFNLEVFAGKPLCLYLTDAESNTEYAITGLDDIYWHRSKGRNAWGHDSEIRLCGYNPYRDLERCKTKKDLRCSISRVRDYYEDRLNDVAEAIERLINMHTADKFELFLSSITVNYDPAIGYVYTDTKFIKENYGVEVRVSDKA